MNDLIDQSQQPPVCGLVRRRQRLAGILSVLLRLRRLASLQASPRSTSFAFTSQSFAATIPTRLIRTRIRSRLIRPLKRCVRFSLDPQAPKSRKPSASAVEVSLRPIRSSKRFPAALGHARYRRTPEPHHNDRRCQRHGHKNGPPHEGHCAENVAENADCQNPDAHHRCFHIIGLHAQSVRIAARVCCSRLHILGGCRRTAVVRGYTVPCRSSQPRI
jgi:hypothetical protein